MKKATAIKRFLLALFVLLVLAGLVAIFRPSGGGSIGQTVTFSDGTTMTLKAVTYGTQHRYLGGGWEQRLLSLLPRKLAAKLSSQQSTLTMGRPSVALWFERVGTGPATGDPQFVLCDASGYGICGLSGGLRMGATGSWIEGWAFEFWPRRERTFTLRIYEQGKRYPDAKSLGEFTLRNPAPDKYPVWTAQEPPLTAREGDLSVTLFDVTAGVGRGANKWKPAPNPTVSTTRVGFRVERNGQPTKEWEITSVKASDATGNFLAGIRSTSQERDAEYVELQPYPWPAEQAWKLRVGLSQRSNFVASQLWTLRGVPSSGEVPTNTAATQTNLQGALVQYAGQLPNMRGKTFFNFRVTPARPDYRFMLVKAVDDRGVETSLHGTFEAIPSWVVGVPIPNWGFALETNATSYDLTLALHQTRYVEFLVRPRIISTNEAAPR